MEQKWIFEVYDSQKLLARVERPIGSMSENQAADCARALAARFGKLTAEEIVGAYSKRRTRHANDHLEVQMERTPDRFQIMCGGNPHVIVRVDPSSPSDRK